MPQWLNSTLVIVTHNMQQAARVSDFTAFLMANAERAGALVEFGATQQRFTNPKQKKTEEYIYKQRIFASFAHSRHSR